MSVIRYVECFVKYISFLKSTQDGNITEWYVINCTKTILTQKWYYFNSGFFLLMSAQCSCQYVKLLIITRTKFFNEDIFSLACDLKYITPQ